MVIEQTTNKSTENKTFYILIFLLSLLAILFGTFFNRINTVQEPQKCQNEAINYPQCDKCQDGKTLVGMQCVNNIQENVPTELTDFEKYESYEKVSIYPDGLVTPDDYMKSTKIYLNDDGTHGVGRKIKITGEVEDAYIYIKAGANDDAGKYTSITEKYDTIFFFLKNGIYKGGHLNLSKSKLGKVSELTEVLFNLKSLSVAEKLGQYRNGAFIEENLLDDLNDNRVIGAVVNTARYGKIENLIIGYKCKSGQNTCSIK